MNHNIEKLRRLRTDLEDLTEEHDDILSRETSIQKPLREASEAAAAVWKKVGQDIPD